MFAHFRAGYERNLMRSGNPGFREHYWISDGYGYLEQPIVDAFPAFGDPHLVAMGYAGLTALAVHHGIHPPKPGPIVISIGFDNEVITVPMTDSISVEA